MKWLKKLILILFIVTAFAGKALTVQSSFPLDTSASELRPYIELFTADWNSLNRFYETNLSKTKLKRLANFYDEWLQKLVAINFDTLSFDGQVDLILFKNYLEQQKYQLELQKRRLEEIQFLLPFADEIIALEEAKKRGEKIEASVAASRLNKIARQIEEIKSTLEKGQKKSVKRSVANRTFKTIGSLRNELKKWFDFYYGYDPLFTWWVDKPYRELDTSLQNYSLFLKEKIVAAKEGEIIGDPVGRDALIKALSLEMIIYKPEELIEMAKEEMEWCREKMIEASKELGFGSDWKRALEQVKSLHVEPGKQPELVSNLAFEAIDFLEKNDLLSIPPLAKETWRMQMLTPEEQLVSPFFLGGEIIRVSYPTNSMSHEAKSMSMRGNNMHFARATVHHELIPGHHLQGFMNARFKPYRRIFRTPFWGEGWALYWEMLLWDLNFPKSPENKIGMLFWRMHRCARVIFSLNFHLGKMSEAECVDFLVNQVGHERANAEAEVRRSFEGDYGPLYQLAYLIGSMQFRALEKEIVKSGKRSYKEFHDTILRENSLPVEILRYILKKERLPQDFKPGWKFYEVIRRK